MWTEQDASGPALKGDAALPRNHLLRALPQRDLERVMPLLQRVSLTSRRVLQHAGVPIDHVYFIEDGLVSVLASADERSTVEVWLIGREGAVGSAALLGARTSPLRYFVQIGGSALRIGIEDLNRAMAEMPRLQATLHSHLHASLIQSSQSAACSLSHSLLQRMARWLLTAQDRSDRNEIPITQDLLARSLQQEAQRELGRLSAVERVRWIDIFAGRQVRTRRDLEALQQDLALLRSTSTKPARRVPEQRAPPQGS